jgi:hypothetical protein
MLKNIRREGRPSVADPDLLDSLNPDPAFQVNPDPDPGF